MPKINPELFQKIRDRSGLGQAQVYKLITAKVGQTFLPRHLAAVAVANDFGIGISRYATADELAQLGGASSTRPKAAPPAPVVAPLRVTRAKTSKASKAPPAKKKSNSVFVVHGRDENIRKSTFQFLRSIGLKPIEWVKAIEMTGKGSPHVSEILDAAFEHAQAIVVLLTPDDEAQLRPHFQKAHDPAYEKELTGQARPNVIFEAGLAFGRNERGTILVEIGSMRPFSDIGGMHTVRLSNSTESRAQLAAKLRTAGCDPDIDGTEWHTAGDFTLTAPPAPEKPTNKNRKR